MNADIIKGNWKEIKGKLRQQWGKLTDSDISLMQGNFEELSGHLQKTYGYKKEEAASEINSFLEKNKYSEKTESE